MRRHGSKHLPTIQRLTAAGPWQNIYPGIDQFVQRQSLAFASLEPAQLI